MPARLPVEGVELADGAVGRGPVEPGRAAEPFLGLGGPAWFDRAGADRAVGELYALYREPGRHVAALAVAR